MEVNAEEYKNFQRFKLIPELAVSMDKIKLFEQKYNIDKLNLEREPLDSKIRDTL